MGNLRRKAILFNYVKFHFDFSNLNYIQPNCMVQESSFVEPVCYKYQLPLYTVDKAGYF